jgi:regulator of sigma E protease
MLNAVHSLIEWIPLGLPAFVFVITTIVFFHELGHFSVARAFGVRIETFSIGFGPAIVRWRDRKGTEWKISWIPLGGFVKFFGDADAASLPDRELAAQMSAADRAVAFPFKPLYQRALIVAAGPIANFILSITVFAAIFAFVGAPTPSTVIGSILPHSAAADAGLRPHDKIVEINGKKVSAFDELAASVRGNKDKPMTIRVVRGATAFPMAVTPRKISTTTVFGDKISVFGLGIGISNDPRDLLYVPVPIDRVVPAAFTQTWGLVDLSLTYVGRIFSGKSSASGLTGPVGIAGITKQEASGGLYDLIWLIAVLSVSIGLVNLFPIPVLDGGHLLYYGCEAVLGRPLGARAQDIGFRLGLAVMLGLFLFATWNDLVRPNLF